MPAPRAQKPEPLVPLENISATANVDSKPSKPKAAAKPSTMAEIKAVGRAKVKAQQEAKAAELAAQSNAASLWASAFDEIFEASRLEIDAFKFEFTRTATGLVSDGRDGDVQDVSGCRMVVESVNNGEPSVCLELELGAEPVRFGRGLQRVELEYVCGEVNSFLDDLNATSPLD